MELLSAALDRDLEAFLAETALQEVESEVAGNLAKFAQHDKLDRAHNADPALARVCYALCRALRPGNVVETGVAYGITSAFLLKAMHLNGTGHLWSIDLPPLAPGADESVGRAVPDHLRNRWSLCRGKSARLLPQVILQASPLDMFIHDSLHTYRNELFEFRAAWPALRDRGVLVSDDIEAHPAWMEWEEQAQPLVSTIFEEQGKASAGGNVVPKFGVMIKQ